uniref:Chromosome 16 open reading frame 46 n=1 Tax=Propithecus coquereli TaxID=379532 RepID=A0A2K6FXM0_PROCO
MDLCQKNEIDIENSENNEIQSTEETELTCTCPDERSEKNHVYCLLNISDITLEQDEKATEFSIGTGWEEAVQGWGRTSSTACIWPRKKLKKARVGESASSGCLVCVNLSQGSLEARPPTEAGLEKDRNSLSQTQGSPQGSNTASREISKICFPTYIPRERKSVQIKEFILCTQDWAVPEAIRGKAPRSPGGGTDRGLSISDVLTTKALLVLPPLKPSLPSGLDVLGKKSKNFFLQSEEKVQSGESVEKDECVACAYRLKTVDQKGEKRPVELAKHLKVNNTLPFPSPVARTCLPAHPQQCLPCSLLPEKNLAFPPNPSNVRCLTTLQLLQKQGTQNCKVKFKAKEPRPPVNTQKHVLTEAKQENGPQTLDTKVFPSPRPLLPSLTVSRVVVPIATQRLL